MANQAERVGVTPIDDILAEMQVLGPADPSVNVQVREDLGYLTSLLLSNEYIAAESEYERFIRVRERSLDIDTPLVRSAIEGRRILVTGGTGCIGRVLLSQLSTFNPAQVVSLESSASPSDTPDVEYANIDLRDGEALRSKLSLVKPDIIFHLAAQRNIATAKENPLSTLRTNISGTHNLIDAAEQVGVAHMVYASSDKALSPLVDGTYAVSKRLTHVVDNSVIFNRLQEWATTGSAISLFSPDISMPVQSATEAAQVLLGSCLEGQPGLLKIQALQSVGMPVSLLHLALGTIAKSNSSSPIYFRDRDVGAEELPRLDVFQPQSADTPMVGEFEAHNASPASFCNNVISLPLKMGSGRELEDVVNWLSGHEHNDVSHEETRAVESSLSWSMFAAVLRELDKETLNLALDQAKSLPGSDEASRITKTMMAIVNEK